VKAELARLLAERGRRTDITADRVLTEYARIGFADFTDYGEGQFKLADKLHALDSVAKHLGMFTERHEVTGKDGGPIAISRIELVPISPRRPALEAPEDD
jgi:hypothetical protein